MSTPINEYTPFLVYLTGITNAAQAVATFSTTHNFTPGENVAFRVSQPYGMVQINNMIGLVLSISTMSIMVDINTSDFTPFVNVGQYLPYPAIVVPSSSGIIPGTATVNLEDAFDNVLTQGGGE